MATFIDLDSIFRDRELYPNPFSYTLSPQQIKSWNRSARTVRAFPQGPNTRPLEFVTTVNIRLLTLPYSDALAALPRIYIKFNCHTYKDINLIQAIDGKHSNSLFICFPERIQTDPTQGDAPAWIHYKCTMEQTIRFKRDDTVTIEFTTRSGDVLPNTDTLEPDPANSAQQSLITFEVTPYLRDNDYSSHMTSTQTV